MSEYLVRIARVLDKPVPVPDYMPIRLPLLKDRQYILPDIRINALDALDLLQCPALSQQVAWRNSSLGKQMQPSQQTHYEKQLINELSRCEKALANDQANTALRRKLMELLVAKRQALPGVTWNLLFANAEFSGQLKGNGLLLPKEGDNGRQGTLEALVYLARYIPDMTLVAPYASDDLERHLQQLSASQYSGQLIASAVSLTASLKSITLLLTEFQNLCPAGKTTPIAQRLYNVFNLFYVSGLQPYLTKITREGKEWRSSVRRLIAVLPQAPSQDMQLYLNEVSGEGEGSIWYSLDQAIKSHTQAWQSVLTGCGMIPSG